MISRAVPEKSQGSDQGDPFDRLYLRWAGNALDRKLAPPQREKWDEIVLFLLQTRDPERAERYRDVLSGRGESLGSDAFDLWLKLPDDAPGKSAPVTTQSALKLYAGERQGSMRLLMEHRGLEEMYGRIIVEQAEHDRQRRIRARKAQNSVLIMGCVGMGAILLMMLSVFLIIALQMLDK